MRRRVLVGSVPLGDRRRHAYEAGHRLAVDGYGFDVARIYVLDHPFQALTADEEETFGVLLPATWWSSFNQGYWAGRKGRGSE